MNEKDEPDNLMCTIFCILVFLLTFDALKYTVNDLAHELSKNLNTESDVDSKIKDMEEPTPLTNSSSDSIIISTFLKNTDSNTCYLKDNDNTSITTIECPDTTQ